jgi:Phasin protein
MTKSSVSTMSSAATQPSTAAVDMGNKLSESWARATSTSVQLTSAWGNEAVRFASRRLARNRDAAERFMKCSSWRDLLDIQVNWTKDLMQDYLDESRELMGMVQEASSGILAAEETGTQAARSATPKHVS